MSVRRPCPAGPRPAHARSVRLAGRGARLGREGRRRSGPGPRVRTKCKSRVLGGVRGTHIRGLGSGEPLRLMQQRPEVCFAPHGARWILWGSPSLGGRRAQGVCTVGARWLARRDPGLWGHARVGRLVSELWLRGGRAARHAGAEVPGVGSCTCEDPWARGGGPRLQGSWVWGAGARASCGDTLGRGSGAGLQGAWERRVGQGREGLQRAGRVGSVKPMLSHEGGPGDLGRVGAGDPRGPGSRGTGGLGRGKGWARAGYAEGPSLLFKLGLCGQR